MTPEERRLIEFVVWELRRGDLPDDVKPAADAVAKTRAYPPRKRTLRRYTEGPLMVSRFPPDETEPLDQRRAFPHQVGDVIQDMLGQPTFYVLIHDSQLMPDDDV